MSEVTKEYYVPSEITPELMQGIVDESVPRAERIINYLTVNSDNVEKVTVNIFVQQDDAPSSFVGFGDRTPLSKGRKIDSYDAFPLHIKEGQTFKIGESGVIAQDVNGERRAAISGAKLASAVSQLEENRIRLITMVWMTVLATKQFSWREQRNPNQPSDKVLQMDYSDSFADLNASGVDLDNDNSKIFLEIDKAQEEYYDNTGFFADIAFVNSTTFNTLKGHPQVYPTIRPQATNEPDNSLSTLDEVLIGSLRFVCLRGKYVKPDGTLSAPLTDGVAMLTTSQNLSDGKGGVMRWEKAQNALNNNNADEPYYEAITTSNDPPAAMVKFYDNGVPVLAHSKGVAKWVMWT